MFVGGIAAVGTVGAVGGIGFNSWGQVLPVAVSVVCNRGIGSCVAGGRAPGGVSATAFVIVCHCHRAAANNHRPCRYTPWEAHNALKLS